MRPPHRRLPPLGPPGSTWQHNPTLRAAVHTAAATLLHPVTTIQRIRIRGPRDTPLLAGNIALAAVLIAAGLWLAILHAMWRSEGPQNLGAILGAFAFAAIFGGYGAVILLHLLTAIEHRGIRFFGARRGWRITSDVATSICAHASAGWLLSGVLVLLGVLLGLWAYALAPGAPRSLRGAFDTAVLTLPIAGFSAGLLVFETLVFLGVRRCRYANPG